MCVILLNVCNQGKNTIKTKVALNFFSLILKVIVGLPWCVCMCVLSCVRLFATLWAHQALFCSWDSPGNNTGVGCQFLLQGISLTQGLNPSLFCPLDSSRIRLPMQETQV